MLRASRDLVARNVAGLDDELVEWAGRMGIDRAVLRGAFVRGLEAGWRTLIAAHAGHATGADNAFTRALRHAGAGDRKADDNMIRGLCEGLAAFIEDPRNIVPTDQKIRDCVVACLELDPDQFQELRAAGGGELAGAFAGTDAEDGFSLLTRDSALAATLSGMKMTLVNELPDLEPVVGIADTEVRDVWQRQLERALDYGGVEGDSLRRLQTVGRQIHRLLRDVDGMTEPFDRILRDRALVDRLMNSALDELPAIGREHAVGLAEAARYVAPTEEKLVEPTVPLMQRLGLGAASDAPAATPATDEPRGYPTRSLPTAPSHSRSGSIEVDELSLDDDLDAASYGGDPYTNEPRLPEGMDPAARDLAAKLCRGINGMDFDEAWAQSGADDAPEAVRDAAVRAAREFALRRPELANTSDAWVQLFIATDPGELQLAFFAHVLAQPMPDHLGLVLRVVSPATLGVLPYIVPPAELHAALADLLSGGDETAIEVVSTYIRYRGATLCEWLLQLLADGVLPDELVPAAIEAFNQTSRDDVLPSLRAIVRKDDTDEAAIAIRRRSARILLALGDSELARQLVQLLPELMHPDGLPDARRLWERDRAIPFFRKLASWSEVSWIPAAWRRELGRLLADLAPGLPEDDLQTLLVRSDLPMSIREPLEEREQRRQAKKLRAGVSIDALREALAANPQQELDAAWHAIGGQADLRVALSIFPPEPVAELQAPLLRWVANAASKLHPPQPGVAIDAAVVDAVEILVRWQVPDVAPHIGPLLHASEPKQAARLCHMLGEAGTPQAIEVLRAFLDQLASSPDGLLVASREGLGAAVVESLVEAGSHQNGNGNGNGSSSCGYLREHLLSGGTTLPNALTLACARHCVDDGSSDGVQQVVGWLANVAWPPLIANVAESLARSGHEGAPELIDYLATTVAGADFAPARAVLAAAATGSSADIGASPEGRRRLLREFARNPKADMVALMLGMLAHDLERVDLQFLGRGLLRLAADDPASDALRTLVEKLPPQASARALATLPAEQVQDIMRKVLSGEWVPDDPAATVRAWLETPGISNHSVLAAWTSFDSSKWTGDDGEKARERVLRRLAELVVSIVESREHPELWLDNVVAVLRTPGIPAASRELVLDRILSTPPESSVKIAEAALEQVRGTGGGDGANGEEASASATTMIDPASIDGALADRLLEWLANTHTLATEAARVRLLQEGLPPRHLLPMLASLNDRAVSGLPQLAANMLREDMLAGVASEADVAFARARLLRCTSHEAVAEQLWDKDTAVRARNSVGAMKVGQPTFWQYELEALATKFRDAPVFVRVLREAGLFETAALFGFGGTHRNDTAPPTAVLAAFAGEPSFAWAMTALDADARARMGASISRIWSESGQADGVPHACEVLRIALPSGPFAPDKSTPANINCTHCSTDFDVSCPKGEETVRATCPSCGARLKVKNPHQ